MTFKHKIRLHLMRLRFTYQRLKWAARRRISWLLTIAPLFGHYLMSVPFLGLSGTHYFNHLDSSAVARMGYDSRSQTLDVHFRKGRALYRYHEVSFFDFLYLVRASSLGRAMNERIIREKPCQHLTWYPTNHGQMAKKRKQQGIKVDNGPPIYPGHYSHTAGAETATYRRA